MARVVHPWKPVYDSNSKVLILGSFPSPRSRAEGFYFGHPQNLFWETLARSLGQTPLAPDADIPAKQDFLLSSHVALWDVLASCEIEGASDASIRDPVANKFKKIIEGSEISAVFVTGRKALSLYDKLCTREAGMRGIYLPSTSPANRAGQASPEFSARWANVGRILRGELVSAKGMKELDRHAIEDMGMPSPVLMERAALGIVDVLTDPSAGFDLGHVVCLCGAGNNGGDGFAAARILRLKGIDAKVLFVGDPAKMSEETALQRRIAENYGVPIYWDGFAGFLGKTENETPTAIVDALFGIGLSRKIDGIFLEAVETVNKMRKNGVRVLAADISSGLCSDTGEILGGCIRADYTVTFAFPKIGMTIGDGPDVSGEIIACDIGITSKKK